MEKQTLSANQREQLLQFLEQPESYPHKPAEVEHIQTHISHVFMADNFVYKFKKPVDFGFLDYSTLEKRREYCRRELKLNRRLTDDIYLGVVPIVRRDENFVIGDNEEAEGRVVEYAVKMRRLPQQYFLHSYLEDDRLTRDHLDRVAQKLADFYRNQQPDEQIVEYGTIDCIKVNTDENFEQTKSFVGQTIEKPAYEAIPYFTDQFFVQCQSLFQRRIDDGCIVDGHGDLHLEHIHITQQNVQIYDCIEFNDRFRYGDWAVDLAYLAMDLDFNARWTESRYFVDQMEQQLEDPDLLQILDFYKCYRAYVKGKVKSLQSAEEEVPEAEREQAAQTAARYFGLSLRYALLGSAPMILAFMGRVGTGKSTLARYLQQRLRISRYSTDRIRKAMANLPLHRRTPAVRRDELYSASMSARTYQALLERAEATLKKGEPVILDGTFNSKSSRKRLQQLAREQEVPLIVIETQVPDEIIKQRLRERDQQKQVVSDARLEDFEKLDERYEPPQELPEKQLLQISTDAGLERTVQSLYQKLIDRQF